MIPLRILLVDDYEDDAALLVAELRRGGFEPNFLRVDTPARLNEALESGRWEIILSDYVMPHLGGLEVLQWVKKIRQNAPVIMVSGKIGEEVAVEALLAGAYDYVMKDNLHRLVPAVRRALSEHALKKERAEAVEAVYRRSHQQEAVAELGMRALSGIEVSDLMQEAAVLVAGVLEAQLSEVLEILPDRKGFLLRAGIGWHEGRVGKAVVPGGRHSQAGFTILSNDPVILKDLSQETRFSGHALLLEHGVVSGLSVAIHGKNLPFGILGVYTTHPHDFSETDVHFVQSVANLLGIAIERHLAEEEMMHAQKMESVGRLAGGVAHDFNNILTVITGYSELLLSRFASKDPIYHDLEEIKRSAEQATLLTRKLLVFSRKQVVQPRVLGLNRVIDDMRNMLQRLIGEDIELSATLAPNLGHIKIDPGHIEQILMNLSVNARDAMPRGGRLVLQTSMDVLSAEDIIKHPTVKPGRYTVLSVTDTGCGMNADTQAHLFEPFFTTKEQGKGTGLGLATVYAIVRQGGGYIDVQSSPGQGSLFKIFLPVTDEPVEPIAPAPAVPPSLNGKETVLVVEDEEVIRNLAQRVLSEKGYRVLEARHGVEALDLCEHHTGPIDLVLTDMVMPQMGGRQFVDSFTQKNPGAKILYMSGYTDRMAEERGFLKEGMNFLQKPFTPQDLVIRVRELLNAGDPP